MIAANDKGGHRAAAAPLAVAKKRPERPAARERIEEACVGSHDSDLELARQHRRNHQRPIHENFHVDVQTHFGKIAKLMNGERPMVSLSCPCALPVLLPASKAIPADP